MTQQLEWKWAAFDDLSVKQFHDVLQLRSAVFVLEQHCLFQDIDGADSLAMHLLGQHEGQIVAYARCFPAGVKFAEASIGRVLTRRAARGGGLGHALIKEAIASVWRQWGAQAIRIGAQSHLKPFYGDHGFKQVGTAYVEDGIDHIEMLLQA